VKPSTGSDQAHIDLLPLCDDIIATVQDDGESLDDVERMWDVLYSYSAVGTGAFDFDFEPYYMTEDGGCSGTCTQFFPHIWFSIQLQLIQSSCSYKDSVLNSIRNATTNMFFGWTASSMSQSLLTQSVHVVKATAARQLFAIAGLTGIASYGLVRVIPCK